MTTVKLLARLAVLQFAQSLIHEYILLPPVSSFHRIRAGTPISPAGEFSHRLKRCQTDCGHAQRQLPNNTLLFSQC